MAASQLAPHVIVLSDPLAGSPVADAVKQMVHDEAKVVVFSDSPSPRQVIAVLEQGASSYLTYDSRPQDIADAVLSVAGGGVVLHASVASVVSNNGDSCRAAFVRRTRLLRRGSEKSCMALAEGLTTKAIARRLGVALKTVESQVRLFYKLGARTRPRSVDRNRPASRGTSRRSHSLNRQKNPSPQCHSPCHRQGTPVDPHDECGPRHFQPVARRSPCSINNKWTIWSPPTRTSV